MLPQPIYISTSAPVSTLVSDTVSAPAPESTLVSESVPEPTVPTPTSVPTAAPFLAAAYLDDINICGPPQRVAEIISRMAQHADELQSGLELNHTKSKIWAPRHTAEDVLAFMAPVINNNVDFSLFEIVNP